MNNKETELFQRVIDLWAKTTPPEKILNRLNQEFTDYQFTLAGDKIIFRELV